jgi:hypothetical protein
MVLMLCSPAPCLALQGESYAVLHAMSWVGALLNGTSPLHVKEDGTPVVSEWVHNRMIH